MPGTVHSQQIYLKQQKHRIVMEASHKKCYHAKTNNKIDNQAKLQLPSQIPNQANGHLKLPKFSPSLRRDKRYQSKSTSRQKNKKDGWAKGFDCLKRLYYNFLCPREEKLYHIVRQKDLLSKIEKMKKDSQADNNPFLSPQKQLQQKTLVIDLEGVLVESSRQRLKNYDFTVSFEQRGKEIKIYCRKRPGAQLFLAEMGEIYEIILFTSCQKEHANAILGQITKPGQIKHRLFREKCLNLNLTFYFKEMHKLNRDPTKVVFVDCNIATGVLQPLNFHLIKRYSSNSDDNQLQKTGNFLKWLAQKPEVTPVQTNFDRYVQEQACQLEQSKLENHIHNFTEASMHSQKPLCQKQEVGIDAEQDPRQGSDAKINGPNSCNKDKAYHPSLEKTHQASSPQPESRRKTLKLHKIIASRKIFSRIEQSLKKFGQEGAPSEWPQVRGDKDGQGRRGQADGRQEKHKRSQSESPVVQIMKKMIQQEIMKSTKILQTVC